MEFDNNQPPKWFFYLAWVLGNAISIPLAGYGAFAILFLVIRLVGGTIQVNGVTHVTEDFLLMYVLVPLLALLTGLIQSLFLRPYAVPIGRWIAATVLGWLAPIAGLGLLSTLTSPLLNASAAGLSALVLSLIGGSIGLFQWLVLRRPVRHAGWWIPANILGWGLAGLVIGTSIASGLDILVLALLPAVASGIGLWLLLDGWPRRPGRHPDRV